MKFDIWKGQNVKQMLRRNAPCCFLWRPPSCYGDIHLWPIPTDEWLSEWLIC